MDSKNLPQHSEETGAVGRAASEASLTYFSPGADWEARPPVDTVLIWETLRRRYRTVLASVGGVLAAIVVITLLMPVKFRSDATLLVETTGDPHQSRLSVLDRALSASSLETEMELIRSRRVVEPLLQELGYNVVATAGKDTRLAADYFRRFSVSPDATPGTYELERSAGGGFVVRSGQSGAVLTQTDSQSEEIRFAGLMLAEPTADVDTGLTLEVSSFLKALEDTRKRISTEPVQADANLIRIACEGPTPEGAQELCLEVSEAYMQLRAELQRSEATAAAEFLTGQVDEVGEQLAAAEDSLREYQTRNLAVALPNRASAELGQQAQLRAQIDQLEAEREALSNLVDRPGGFQDLASFPTFLKSENRVVANLVATLVELQNRRSELAVTRTDRNPDIISIDNRIEQIEQQLRSFATNYEQALDDQIASLRVASGRSGSRLTSIPTLQVETARLERQVASLEDLYGFLQVRLREAEVAKAVNLPSVRFVDEASLPLRQESPKVALNLVLGILIGLGMGVVFAFYQERTDSRVRGQGEVERETGIPVLTMLPNVRNPNPILPIRLAQNGVGNGSHGSRSVELADETGREVAMKLSWEDEVVLEAFRSLATDLGFATERASNGRARTICVTSSGRGDGKTYTSCNLAVANAGRGLRVLLIDADLRASGVARFFGLPWTSPGLTDVLLGEAQLSQVVQNLAVGQRETMLRVVSAGSPKYRSTGMLETYADVLRELIAYGEAKFDLVVVDTPPLNILTDAASIAARVDGVVVVVRGGYTDKSALELTLKRLQRARASVLGLVLNDVDLPESYTSYSQQYVEEAPS